MTSIYIKEVLRWFTKKMRGNSCSPWNGIVKEKLVSEDNSKCKVSSNASMQLWRDIWLRLEGQQFKIKFLNLFADTKGRKVK